MQFVIQDNYGEIMLLRVILANKKYYVELKGELAFAANAYVPSEAERTIVAAEFCNVNLGFTFIGKAE